MAKHRPLEFAWLSATQLLQASLLAVLGLSLAVHTFAAHALLAFISQHRTLVMSLAWCFVVGIGFYISARPRPVFLLDYSCFRPLEERRCSLEVCEYLLRRRRCYSAKSEEFMRGIYGKSGLSDETYAPPFLFQVDSLRMHSSAIQEAEEGMFGAVDQLLAKTKVPVSLVDTLIVSAGSFAPAPSLAAILVNRYGLDPSVKTYNLAGMGCSAGAMAIDLSGRSLSRSRRVRYALLVITENISSNWYLGDDRSMLVPNCIFRVGCAALLLTSDPSRRPQAKMQLLRSLRTHRGADDASYLAAFQMEDEAGNVGVSLKKDLIRVAGEGLKEHIRTVGMHCLPLSQLLRYGYTLVASWVTGETTGKVLVPEFRAAFEHIVIHTGGKAVIESLDRALRFGDDKTEAARMTLHRFGNTSSSLIFYELAYLEAKGKVRKGDKIWMLAFGTGFKVCSVFWKSLRQPSAVDLDNPWRDCVRRYPLEAW